MNFKIGDVCIGQNARWDFSRNGMECVIVGELELRTYWTNSECTKSDTGMCYEVEWADGEIGCGRPDQLRLKKPPAPPERQQVGEWELCPWKPGLRQTVLPSTP